MASQEEFDKVLAERNQLRRDLLDLQTTTAAKLDQRLLRENDALRTANQEQAAEIERLKQESLAEMELQTLPSALEHIRALEASLAEAMGLIHPQQCNCDEHVEQRREFIARQAARKGGDDEQM